ncbi:hypothetical protein [Pseudomonas citronellolis]|nr:hypothetical protein [Pseudomonas citronellolis]
MSKQQIIDAIKKLAHDTSLSPSERQAALEDIEFAAQDQREKLEELYED